MDILGIEYVEFYVEDAREAAHTWCATYGFRDGGTFRSRDGEPGVQSLLVQQGDIDLVLTTSTVPGHPAYDYVARHGDGVGVIAFAVADVQEAFEEAVRRGADVVTAPSGTVAPEIRGFGDVVHRFVPRGPEAGPGRAADLLQEIDHVAVCLPAGTLRPTTDFYRKVLDFEQIFEEYVEVGGQAMDSTVVQSRSGGATFTLIEPDTTKEPGQIAGFLDAHEGAGVQHLAFRTDDITEAVPALQDRGVEFLTTPSAYYDALADRLGELHHRVPTLRDLNILVDRDHWGDVFQIFARSEHPRRTYFSEIIDRHGAKTFGSGNIKALYQAVERQAENTAVAGS
ncbi:4-hydroxyphenylpyruvate dioxygenase [Streptomyces hyaluromycini]|uniref:4-hydroxyphenylpyruvate dioxygenase n=1 Tax=Streptomyces hyaluromycini TaxID=1377993 RepID=A0ABV1WNY0_9ACTN